MTDNLFSWGELKDVTGGIWAHPPEGEGGIGAVSTDSRTIENGDLYLALCGERFDGHDFVEAAVEKGAAALLVSKRVTTDLPCLLVPDTLEAYQALAKFHRDRFPDLLMVGITGSSGKTSSKEILSAAANAAYGEQSVLVTQGNTNNHIGVPRNLLRLTRSHKCAVLEMGTNAPGEIATLRRLVQPTVSVLTNVGPVHLEGLGSIDGVAEEKGDVFFGAELGILPWIFADNPIIAKKLPKSVMRTGFHSSCDVILGTVKNELTGSRFSVTMDEETASVQWELTGNHMAMNAAAAFALGPRLGLTMAQVAEALKTCHNESMRMQVIERGGSTFVNDAYNANPDSMKALIDWLSDVVQDTRRLVLIVGDMLELGDNEIELHDGILDYAHNKLPDAKVVGFGPRFAQAAGGRFDTFEDIDRLKQMVSELESGATIAFKGSRGMGLERILS